MLLKSKICMLDYMCANNAITQIQCSLCQIMLTKVPVQSTKAYSLLCFEITLQLLPWNPILTWPSLIPLAQPRKLTILPTDCISGTFCWFYFNFYYLCDSVGKKKFVQSTHTHTHTQK